MKMILPCMALLLSACTPNIYQLTALRDEVAAHRKLNQPTRDQLDTLLKFKRVLDNTKAPFAYLSRLGLKSLVELSLPIKLNGQDLNSDYLTGNFFIERVVSLTFDEAGNLLMSLAFRAPDLTVDLSMIPMAGEVTSKRLSRALRSGGVASFVLTPVPETNSLNLRGRCVGMRLNRHDDLIYRRHLIHAVNRTFFSKPWRVTLPPAFEQQAMAFGAARIGWFWYGSPTFATQ